MQIRKIREIYLSQCAGILKTAYESKPFCEIFKNGNPLKYIKNRFNHCKKHSFVALESDRVIGFVFYSISCWAEGPQAILEEIVIDKEHQNMGVGKELIKYSHVYLKKEGVKSIMLWANKDPRVIGFHKNNGYIESNNHIVMFNNLN